MPIAPLAAGWARRYRNLPGPVMGSEALPVTFPSTRLTIRVLIALGADLTASPLTWAWEDITAYVRFDPGIDKFTGRPDEASTVLPGRATLRLDNRDGRFTRRNPNSPYFGLLSMNTPIWVTVDPGPGVVTRLEMFVNSWPNRWPDKSGNDCVVTIECAGVMRRLGQGGASRSPLRRSILATSPEAYWTLEDSGDATSAGSAVGGSPMVAAGTVTFASYEDLVGATQTPAMSAGSLLGSISGVSATSWHAEFLIKTAFRGPVIARVYTTSALANTWRIFVPVDASASVSVFVTDSGFITQFSMAGATAVGAAWENNWHHICVTAQQSGTSVVGSLYVDGVFMASGSVVDTLTAPVKFWANPLVETVTSMAHIAVGSGTAFSDAPDLIDGFVGELAHARMTRLCAEESIQFRCLASTSQAMGPQGTDTLLSLLRECEAADQGVLYETGWGLAYQSVAEKYNAPVSLTLDFNSGHIAEIPEPADDDQRVRNKWTISRATGSESTMEQTTGPMGTGTLGPGVYDDSATVNLETDDQLGNNAGWRVHLGTVDEDRWPRLDINLTRNASLIDEWTTLPWGARLNATNPPSQITGTVDAVNEGYGEHIDPILWTAALTTSPASSYRVMVIESSTGNLGRISGNSTLAADATSGATTISVASASGLWTTGTVNFDILVAGERMTVTNIAGASSPQTFTVTRAVNGVTKDQPATVAGVATIVGLWQPAVIAL